MQIDQNKLSQQQDENSAIKFNGNNYFLINTQDDSEVSKTQLRQKISQIIGFKFDEDVSIDNIIEMLKQQDGSQSILNEVQSAIERSKIINTQEGVRQFLRKDLSQIQQNQGLGTIYAIDVESDPELNKIERIYRLRDQLVERGEIRIILPEEELKKHQKDPKMNKQPPEYQFFPNQRFLDPINIKPIPQNIGNINQEDPEIKKDGQQNQKAPNQAKDNIIFPTDNSNLKRYCICAKQNDDREYVQCENQCEWYHPDCVGFDQSLFVNKSVKFLCPFCDPKWKKKFQVLEEKNQYVKIKSNKKNEYYAFIPKK